MNIPIFETLREAAYDQGSRLLSGVILQAGLSQNGNFYPPETLAGSAERFEGVKCFIDHARDGNVGHRSIRDVCGVVEECRFDSGKLRAIIRVSESHDWIAAMVNEGILGDVSINALGRTRLSRRDGRVVREVTEISKAYSVDFVTEAAAGGRVEALLRESAGFSEGLRLIENMTLAELRESRPDLVARLQDENPTDEPQADENGGEMGDTEGVGSRVDVAPLIEGALGSRQLPPFVATYLREHLAQLAYEPDSDMEGVIEKRIEEHLDYLGALSGMGVIRPMSVRDHLQGDGTPGRRSTFRFLGLK